MGAQHRWEEIAEELGSYDLGIEMQTEPTMIRQGRFGGPGGIYRAGGYVDAEPACTRIAEQAEQIAELLEALRGLLPDQDAGWWCSRCVAETDATFEERCSVCGEHLSDPGASEAIRVARAAIAKATGTEEAR